jgi:tRNA uridine 5-carboxymethylaminomethyl modification enzyme
VQVKYEGYIKRELAEAAKQKKLEEKKLPKDISYKDILGLRLEAAEKLDKIRPESLGQASRISGVNPADISVLLIYLSQGKCQ